MGLKWTADIDLARIKGATIQKGKDGRRWLLLDAPDVFFMGKNGQVKLDLVAFDKPGQYSDGFVKRGRRKDEPKDNDDPIIGNYKDRGQDGGMRSNTPSARPAFE